MPQPHIAAISLTPAPAICRVRRVYIVPATATIAQARVAARMALAELRAQREIRIVVDIPEIPDPAAL